MFYKEKRKQKIFGKRREEQEQFRWKLYLHASELAVEMNIRLFLEEETEPADTWWDLCDSNNLLFVEDISIMEICYPGEMRELCLLRKKLQCWFRKVLLHFRHMHIEKKEGN